MAKREIARESKLPSGFRITERIKCKGKVRINGVMPSGTPRTYTLVEKETVKVGAVTVSITPVKEDSGV